MSSSGLIGCSQFEKEFSALAERVDREVALLLQYLQGDSVEGLNEIICDRLRSLDQSFSERIANADSVRAKEEIQRDYMEKKAEALHDFNNHRTRIGNLVSYCSTLPCLLTVVAIDPMEIRRGETSILGEAICEIRRLAHLVFQAGLLDYDAEVLLGTIQQAERCAISHVLLASLSRLRELEQSPVVSHSALGQSLAQALAEIEEPTRYLSGEFVSSSENDLTRQEAASCVTQDRSALFPQAGGSEMRSEESKLRGIIHSLLRDIAMLTSYGMRAHFPASNLQSA